MVDAEGKGRIRGRNVWVIYARGLYDKAIAGCMAAMYPDKVQVVAV